MSQLVTVDHSGQCEGYFFEAGIPVLLPDEVITTLGNSAIIYTGAIDAAQSLPSPIQMLASITGIDGKVAAIYNFYTPPEGKILIPIGAIMRITDIEGAGGGEVIECNMVDIGETLPTILSSSQDNAGLSVTFTTDFYTQLPQNYTVTGYYTHETPVVIKLYTPAVNVTKVTLAFDLWGYLVDA